MPTLTEGPRTMARHPEPGELWTPDQLAELLKLNRRTLANWRVLRKGPRHFRLGDNDSAPVRYRAEDILAWLDEHGWTPEDER
jgi:hypothetical protein